MSTWDDFEVAGDTDGSATLECKRCDRNASPVLLIPAWHQSTLQQLQDAATEHLRDVHRGDPITVEYVGATPYQEPRDDGSRWQYRGGDGNPTMRRLIDANGEELEPWQLVVPYRADFTFQKGGQVVHTPTALRRSCGWSWDTTEPEATGHRCGQPADSIHEHHRCGCGITTPAAMTPGDPVVAQLSQPGQLDPYQRSADAP